MILGLVHHHHDIVRGLVVDHQLAVSVGDDTTRRELHLLEEGIRVGTLLVVITGDLKCKQADNIDDYNRCSHPTNHESSVFKSIVSHFLRTVSIDKMRIRVSKALLPAQVSQWIQS